MAMNGVLHAGGSGRRSWAAASGLALLLVLGAPLGARAEAAASPAPASAAPGGTEGSAEVVVTAQKRREDEKAVPISLSVLSGAEVQAQRISDYEELSRAVPDLSFNTWNGAEGRDAIEIRGVSSTSGTAVVGVYLDDIPITVPNLYRDGAVEPRLADLEAIEVLRGPQGTLFGASSEGGTIRFLTQAPNMSVSSATVTADGSYTDHGAGNDALSGVFNLPVAPGLFALRASVTISNASGWINHYAPAGAAPSTTGVPPEGALEAKGVNGEQGDTVHLVGRFTPGDDLVVTPSFFYQRVHDSDNAAFFPALGLFNQDKSVPEPATDTVGLIGLTLKKGLGFADFTSVTGLFDRQYDRQEDGTFFNSVVFGNFYLDPLFLNPAGSPQSGGAGLSGGALSAVNSFYSQLAQTRGVSLQTLQAQLQAADDTVIAGLPSPVEFHTAYRQFTQEFRLSSPDDPTAALKWVGGVYFSYQKVHNTDFQQIPGINSAFQAIYGLPISSAASPAEIAYAPAPGTTLFPNDEDEADNRSYQEWQGSVFGQIDYAFFKTWHAGLGGRYLLARDEFNSVETGFYQLDNISPFTQKANFSAFTPKATLSDDVTPQSTVYASAGKGFRLGGPTGPTPFGPTSVCAGDFANDGVTTNPTQFASDSLWTYELGAKNRWFDNRLSVDVSGFYTNWTNVQQQIYLPTCGYYFTTNIGDATIYGGEVSAVARITSNLRLSVTASSNNATITKTNNPLIATVGEHLIDVPEVTVTVGGVYTVELPGGYALAARADYEYTGQSYGNYSTTNTDYLNPAYGVANFSLALSRDRYEVDLYVKNAFNNQQIIQQPEINTVIEGYTVHPLTVGLTTKARF